MNRRTLPVCIALVALVAVGCSDSDPLVEPTPFASATTPAAEPPPESRPWTPLTTAAPADRNPMGLSGRPSLAAGSDAAEGDGDRVAGERFALVAAHLILDVRPELRGQDVMNTLASSSLDPDVRSYLEADIDLQQRAGTQRSIDTGRELWFRSEVVGSEAAPKRLNVQLLCVVNSVPLQFSSWIGLRIDVARGSGRWELVGYSDGAPSPRGDSVLTPMEQRKYLTGPGWRRIPAIG